MVVRISKEEFLDLAKSQKFKENIFVLYKDRNTKAVELCFTINKNGCIESYSGVIKHHNKYRDIRTYKNVTTKRGQHFPVKDIHDTLVSWLSPDTTYITVTDGDFSSPIWFIHNMVTEGTCCFGIQKGE